MKTEISGKQANSSPLINQKIARIGSRKSLRRVLGGLGFVGGIVYASGLIGGALLLVASGIAVFLAITDFGRQCPLISSLRYTLFRPKSRRIPPID